MTERISSTQEHALRKRLRREAMDDRPEFDERLHRRIVAAVRRRQAEHASARVPAVVRWRGRLAAAFAAACLLCAVTIGWRMMQRENTVDAQFDFADSGAILSLPGEWAGSGMDKLEGATLAAALQPHSSDLARDTRTAAEALLERLPAGLELLAGP
jgi:hypothetical protein